MTKEEFKNGMKLLKIGVPKIDIDPEGAYFFLNELSCEDFIYAIKEVVRDNDFKLYDNIIGILWDKATSRNSKTPEESWELVMDQIRKEGYLGNPKFEDNKIMRVINSNGGWVKLCSSEEINWDKKRFIETYNDFKESEQAKIRSGELNYQEQGKIENKEAQGLIKDLTKNIGNL